MFYFEYHVICFFETAVNDLFGGGGGDDSSDDSDSESDSSEK